jgi:hypothetical protein
MKVLDDDNLILFAARVALRMDGHRDRWVPSPSHDASVRVLGCDVQRLVRAGKLEFGNRSKTFVVPVSPSRRRLAARQG